MSQPTEITSAPALVAGEWIDDGPTAERVGPVPPARRQPARSRRPPPTSPALPGTRRRRPGRSPGFPPPPGRMSSTGRPGLAAERRDELATQLALELGKPVKDGRGEIDRVADTLAVCAAEARRIGGEVLPVAGWARGVGNTALTYRAPPASRWPSPRSTPRPTCSRTSSAPRSPPATPPSSRRRRRRPASSAAVVEPAARSGHAGRGRAAAARRRRRRRRSCARRTRSAVISFTGSAATGAAVARAAGAKRLVLELGGNAATIVCEDADIPAAARICARTGYSNSGQSCISVQRVYVQRDRFEEFAHGARRRGGEAARRRPARRRRPTSGRWSTRRRPSGSSAGRPRRPPAGARVLLGGTRDGATVRADRGGGSARRPRPSWCTRCSARWSPSCPTTTSTRSSRRATPAGTGCRPGCSPATSAGSSPPGGSSQVGGLVVNGSSNFRLDHVPFGGVKDSGFGRESPRWMIDDYTVVKTLLLRGMSIFGEESA